MPFEEGFLPQKRQKSDIANWGRKVMLKPERIVVAGILCLVLLASPAFATSGNVKQSQSLSLILQGMISNAGNQHYELGGGKLVQGSLFGQTLSPGRVSFDLDANVNGLRSVSGRGTLEISATQGHGGDGDYSGVQANDDDGDHSEGAEFSAHITITGSIAAAIFPITLTSPTSYSNCDPTTQTCNSEIPLFFTGIATVNSEGGHDPTQIPIAIESPYWNPLGGPIVITSLDSTTNPSVFLIVSYDRATIDWDGVQLQGSISGSFGTETVTGLYGQGVNSLENLVSAKEYDMGSITFASMSDQTLNALGRFSGHTTFSLAGSFDCSSEFGLPEGTCTATGATSDGSFRMSGGQDTFISGTYHTVWSVPSLFTVTTVIGAVTQH